jgi:hypothetical protein
MRTLIVFVFAFVSIEATAQINSSRAGNSLQSFFRMKKTSAPPGILLYLALLIRMLQVVIGKQQPTLHIQRTEEFELHTFLMLLVSFVNQDHP